MQPFLCEFPLDVSHCYVIATLRIRSPWGGDVPRADSKNVDQVSMLCWKTSAQGIHVLRWGSNRRASLRRNKQIGWGIGECGRGTMRPARSVASLGTIRANLAMSSPIPRYSVWSTSRLVGLGGTSSLSEPPHGCTQIRCPMCFIWRRTSHVQKEVL